MTEPLQTGEIVNTTLRIRTSFAWASPAERTALDALQRGQRMLYDITAKSDEWIISGRKKGEFLAQHGGEISIPLSLSPIKPGRLLIPSVMTFPLQGPGQSNKETDALPSCETNHENAATSVVVIQQDSSKARLWIDRAAGDIAVLS